MWNLVHRAGCAEKHLAEQVAAVAEEEEQEEEEEE